MEFNAFLDSITKLKENDLAAATAHSLLAPHHRMDQLQSIDFSKVASRKAAVLLHFYPSAAGKVNFVLIQRQVYEGVHSGQVSFPGGKPEVQDNHLWATALREAFEEVGLPSDQVKFVRSLSPLYVPPSNFFITPFVGYSECLCEFIPEPNEVDAIIEISLEDLLDKRPVMTRQPLSSSDFIEVPAYVLNGYKVWGATAMILSEFKMLITGGLYK